MIRLATTDDLDAIIAIDANNGYKPWSENTLRSSLYPDSSFVCLKDDEVVAFALFHAVIDEVELLNVVVLKQYEGQGLATTILEYGENYFREKGFSYCFLEVGVDNDRARDFYARRGYKILATRKNYYVFIDKKVDANVMSKQLG